MDRLATAGGRWRVADLVIDAGAKRIFRDAETIELPQLSFSFLLSLIEASPNVLSVDDLMERVWPGIFVNSETVTQRAKLLRDALSDDPRSPRYFTVRRGVGYQLIPEPVPIPRSSDVVSAVAKWKKAIAALALGIVVLGTVIGLLQWRNAHSVTAAAQLRIAVLPFDNLSSDPADAFIARSIPEIVLNRLSSVRGLAVISRESALLSQAASGDPQTAARQLQVAYVVRGSVQRNGAKLRVTCFVVDTKSGARLWSEQFDWPVDRLYALQDRIAERVTASLETKVRRLGPLPPAAPNRNSDAYLAFLRGKSLIGRFTVAETDAASNQFERAVRLDPEFAPAMVALYDARMQGADLRKDDLAPVRAQLEPMLERALRIDPNSGEALFAQAMWSTAPRDERLGLFRRAATLDPSNARGLTAFAQFLGSGSQLGINDVMGDGGLTRDGPESTERKQLLDRVLSIDPLNQRARFILIQQNISKLTPDELERQQVRALELDPGNAPLVNRYANRRWMFHGESAEAIGILEPLIADDPQNPWGVHIAAPIYLDANDPEAARTVAESTPASRDSTRALFAQFRGDWRAAGEAALGPRGFLFNRIQNWLWAESVRDYALNTRQYDRGAEAIASRYGFDLRSPRTENLAQSTVAPLLGHILLAAGKRAEGERLLAQTVQWLDAHPRYGMVGIYRTRASAMMLLGERDQALSNLQAVIVTARDRRHWWYLIERDPVWEPVRNDPRFREIAEFCRQAAREQRGKLDTLRRQGKVPPRPGRS